MKNLVFLGFLALLGFAVAGWYLDWYTVAGTPTNTGHHRIAIDIDSQKIKADTGKFIEKSKAKLQDTLEKSKKNTQIVGPPAPDEWDDLEEMKGAAEAKAHIRF